MELDRITDKPITKTESVSKRNYPSCEKTIIVTKKHPNFHSGVLC